MLAECFDRDDEMKKASEEGESGVPQAILRCLFFVAAAARA